MYKELSRLRGIMTKLFHACDDCAPMRGVCHVCWTSNVEIINRKLILCQDCSQAS